MRRRVLCLSILCCMVPIAVTACLWDYDTLKMERAQFPGIAELISGKFLRHSSEFYEWRISDRRKKILENPEDVRLYDDLSVAYDKTGQHEQAIQTILRVQAIQPDRYETYANLGTFHIHSGDLETGKKFIDRAIEINADAHFGREIYQQLLVEYVLERRGDGPLPQPMSTQSARFGPRGFAEFLALRKNFEIGNPQNKDKIAAAVKGISGMMRFGNHDSPVLLEALADLLMAQNDELFRNLAARAWLKASYSVEDQAVRARYRKAADQVLSLQTDGSNRRNRVSLESVEQQFRKELADADAWFERLRKDEQDWIAAGEDVDLRFSDRYYTDPVLPSEVKSQAQSRRKMTDRSPIWSVQFWPLYAVLIVIGFVIFRNRSAVLRRIRSGVSPDERTDID